MADKGGGGTSSAPTAAAPERSAQSSSNGRSSRGSSFRGEKKASLEASDSQDAKRLAACWEVFHDFDLDKSGLVESSEMLALGEARHEMGGLHGGWSEADNRKLIERLEGDSEGQVNGDNFVKHLNSDLESVRGKDFDEAILKFKSVAKACRNNVGNTERKTHKAALSGAESRLSMLQEEIDKMQEERKEEIDSLEEKIAADTEAWATKDGLQKQTIEEQADKITAMESQAQLLAGDLTLSVKQKVLSEDTAKVLRVTIQDHEANIQGLEAKIVTLEGDIEHLESLTEELQLRPVSVIAADATADFFQKDTSSDQHVDKLKEEWSADIENLEAEIRTLKHSMEDQRVTFDQQQEAWNQRAIVLVAERDELSSRIAKFEGSTNQADANSQWKQERLELKERIHELSNDKDSVTAKLKEAKLDWRAHKMELESKITQLVGNAREQESAKKELKQQQNTFERERARMQDSSSNKDKSITMQMRNNSMEVANVRASMKQQEEVHVQQVAELKRQLKARSQQPAVAKLKPSTQVDKDPPVSKELQELRNRDGEWHAENLDLKESMARLQSDHGEGDAQAEVEAMRAQKQEMESQIAQLTIRLNDNSQLQVSLTKQLQEQQIEFDHQLRAASSPSTSPHRQRPMSLADKIEQETAMHKGVSSKDLELAAEKVSNELQESRTQWKSEKAALEDNIRMLKREKQALKATSDREAKATQSSGLKKNVALELRMEQEEKNELKKQVNALREKLAANPSERHPQDSGTDAASIALQRELEQLREQEGKWNSEKKLFEREIASLQHFKSRGAHAAEPQESTELIRKFEKQRTTFEQTIKMQQEQIAGHIKAGQAARRGGRRGSAAGRQAAADQKIAILKQQNSELKARAATGSTTSSSQDEFDKLKTQNTELWKLLNDDNLELESMAQKIVTQEEELNQLRSEDTLTPLRPFDSSTVSALELELERSFQPNVGRSVSAPRGAAIRSTDGSVSSLRTSPQPQQGSLSTRWALEELNAQSQRPTYGSTRNSLSQQERSTEDSTAKILSQQRELADQIRRERSVREESKKSGRSASGNAVAGYKERPRSRAHDRQEESDQLQHQAWNLQKELLGASMESMGRESHSAKASLVSSDF